MCFSRFSTPFAKASRFSSLRSFSSISPCNFSALTVATTTAALGLRPDFLHLIFKNFSAPKSAPKPASVIT